MTHDGGTVPHPGIRGNSGFGKIHACIARDCGIAARAVPVYPSSMSRYLSRETEPFGKWKGIPIYLTTILTALFVAGLIATTVLRAARSPLLDLLAFGMPPISPWGWFGIVTYPFLGLPNFFTPFAILCFYMWSVGIESHLGRRPLVKLLLLLTLAPVITIVFLWYAFGVPGGIQGNYILTVGLIIAFATLYPNAEIWGWIPFKYFAAFCVGCGVLVEIGDKNWGAVIQMFVICLAAFLHMRHALEQEYDDHVPLGARIRSWFRRKPKFRVVQRRRTVPLLDSHRDDENEDDMEGEVDVLLEKIARSGISSLTAEERERLEQARENLLKKERK